MTCKYAYINFYNLIIISVYVELNFLSHAAEMFVDYELKKSLQITNLGTEGAAKVYLLTIGEEKKTYQYLE